MCVCNLHSTVVLKLKAENEVHACAEWHAAKLAARQACRQQAQQEVEAALAPGEKILDVAGAAASSCSSVDIEQSTGKGLVDGMSELAGGNSMPDPTSFVAGNVQAVEAAEQSAQGQECTGLLEIDVACGVQCTPGVWHAACTDEVNNVPLPLMARVASSLVGGSHAALGAELGAQSAELAEQPDVNRHCVWCAMCETGAVQPLILGASAAHNESSSDCITATQLATLQQVTEL